MPVKDKCFATNDLKGVSIMHFLIFCDIYIVTMVAAQIKHD